MKVKRNNVIIALLLATMITLPAQAADNEPIIKGDGIFIRAEESWSFQQGYTLQIKDVNPSDNSLWIELLLENQVLKDAILHEGETFTYSKNSKEIFNITVDTIYSGPEGELVTFKPVYQYMDPDLPAPRPDDAGSGVEENEKSNQTDENNVQNSDGFSMIQASAILIAAALFCLKRKY